MAPCKPKPHFPPSHPRAAAIPRSSRTSFLFKSLFFALLLALLPLFPSKPPESLHRTIFADFWELLHLLFIGVVVSYGLFSHRRKNTDNRIEICSNVADFESYGNRLFHVSSVLEDEFEVPLGSEEKNDSVFGELKNLENGFGYKPLGLPVRSLKSRARNTRSVKLGELGPLNLEKKFNEEVALPSPIPWRSRSGRMEMRENVDNYTRPLHSRNFSVEESGFERRKSDSFRSTKSLRSRRSSISEFPDLEIKELERKKSFHGSSSSSDLSSSSKEINGKNSVNALSSWRNGNSCLSEKDARECFEPEPKKLGRKKSFRGSSSSPDSSSSSKEINGKKSVNASNSWRYGSSCLSEKNARESFENVSEKLSKREDPSLKSEVKLSQPKYALNHDNHDRLYSSVHPNASGSWQYGNSGLSEKDPGERFENASKKWSKREDPSLKSEVKLSPPEYAPNDGNHDRLYNSSHPNKPIKWDTSESKNEMLQKSASFVKASSRGKSVRTIRASGYSKEETKVGDTFGNPFEDRVLKNPNIIGSFSKPKSTFSDYQNEEKQEDSENLCVEHEEEECESEAEVFQVSSDEEEVASDADAVSDECDEVDKKAGEFIANFREQIRLQKVASFERSAGWSNFSCFL